MKIIRLALRNLVLIAICAVMLYPIFSTVLLSIKDPSDVRRKPPVLLPCNTPTGEFALSACRASLQGYQRIFLPQAATGNLFEKTLS